MLASALTRWRARCRLGLEAILVEDLRGEVAQVGMEAPGVLEEQPEGGRHGRGVAEDVRERRPVRTRRMAALEWLVELLRIAEQHEAVAWRGPPR